MNNQRATVTLLGIAVLLLLLLTGLTWTNYRFVEQNPGGNDFLPRWEGTRLFLKQGQNPYSEETTKSIQHLVYGRKARPGEDQVLFVYPFYSVLVFAPFALVKDYPLARALWMTALEVALVALTFVSISLSRWRMNPWKLALLLVFSLLWYHGLRPVINGNASILCALFIALAFQAIRSQVDPLAGFLLALATIKPQMVVLLIPFVLLWAASQRRWTLFWSTIASLAFLTAVMSLFVPTWTLDNLRQMIAYPNYTQPGSPGAIFSLYVPGIGRQLGWALTAVGLSLLIVEWRAAWGKDFKWFLWTASLTLAITNLIGIRTATENYIALFPGMLLVFANWDERWRRAGQWLVVFSLVTLFFGLWAFFLRTMQSVAHGIQSPLMFFPLPFLLLFGLYWIRWWAIRPPRVFLDQMKSFQGNGYS